MLNVMRGDLQMMQRAIWAGVLATGAVMAPLHGAGPDGLVEGDGVSHLVRFDLSPRVPVRDAGFEVWFQTLRDDLTSARVRQFVSGTPVRVFDAAVVGQRGPYDLWSATVDGRDADLVEYDIELIDGADTDYAGPSGVGESAPAGGRFQLDFLTYAHAPYGATVLPGGQGVFRVFAPTAASANVRGTFNGWSLTDPMTRVGDDFIALVDGVSSGSQYKYYFPATATWQTGAFARRINFADNANTVVDAPDSHVWSSEPFAPDPAESLVLYQLHVGTFAGRNDPAGGAPTPSRFIDMTARADHLSELGVNAVYLNPVIEWPGSSSGGYNPINFTTIESSYGTPAQCRSMVDELHGRGIAVVLDLVYNHFDGGGTYLDFYTGAGAANDPFFDSPAAQTPWGPQPDLDDPAIRALMIEAAVSLLEEYRFDGFRMDALSAFIGSPQPAGGTAFLLELNELMERRYRDKLFIAEIFGDDPWASRPLASGGLGFDTQYHQFYRDSIRNAVFALAGVDGASDPDVTSLANSMTRRDELRGVRAFNYFELHDEAWPLNGRERAVRQIDPSPPSDSTIAVGASRLALGMTLLARGMPAFLMGSEWLEDDGWEFNKLDWSHKTQYAGQVALVSDLIGLRTARPELFAGALGRPTQIDEVANLFAVERVVGGGGSMLIVANFSSASVPARRFGLPRDGAWRVVLNSDAIIYDGSGVGSDGPVTVEAVPADGFNQSASLEIPGAGFLVLEHQTTPACVCERTGDQPPAVDVTDLLDYLALWFVGDAGADLDASGATDVQDLLAFLVCWFDAAGGVCA